MILPYALRLLCLSFASFFLLNAAAAVLVRLFSNPALRFADSITARRAARLLFALRVSPVVLAALFVLALCIPSYLWLEPHATRERVSFLCAVFGFLGAVLCLASCWRAARAVIKSVGHNRHCVRAGLPAPVPGKISDVVVVDRDSPLLAMSGLFRPQLLVSSLVLRELSSGQLDVAFSHELAHRGSRDNLKRLFFLLAPDSFPFINPLKSIERSWAKFSEWAADDEAAAGDSIRAVSLAAALVGVARLGSSPCLPELSTSLLAADRGLAARVERLLRTVPVAPVRGSKRSSPFGNLLALAGCLALLLLSPLALASVHELLEHLIR
jgi:hypothetical protein